MSKKVPHKDMKVLNLVSQSFAVLLLIVKLFSSALSLVSEETKYETRNVIEPKERITIAEIIPISFMLIGNFTCFYFCLWPLFFR